MSKFQYKDAVPFHISVGAVIANDEGNILAHHFDTVTIPDTGETLEDIYILMRETLKDDESLEGAIHRGMMEEMGTDGEILRYLGPLDTLVPRTEGDIQKLTLYFAVRAKSFDSSRRKKSKDDYESVSEVDWYEPSFLVQKMQEQKERFDRGDITEAVIIERYLKHYG